LSLGYSINWDQFGICIHVGSQ